MKSNLKRDQFNSAQQLVSLSKGSDLVAETINQARKLEGNIRNTGTHACGIIITPQPLNELIPITRSKDSDLLVTQFDNSVVEDAGLLKNGFFRLKKSYDH